MCCYLQLAELFIYFDKYGRIIWHDASDSLKVFNRKWTAGYSYIRVIVVKILMSIWHLRANLIEVILVTAALAQNVATAYLCSVTFSTSLLCNTNCHLSLAGQLYLGLSKRTTWSVAVCLLYQPIFSAEKLPICCYTGMKPHRTNGMLFFEWH